MLILLSESADANYHERSRDYWARNVSPNKAVKVYIGAPGATGAAGGGYVPIETLSSIATKMRQSYPSFGGVMLWDASQAYGKKFRLVVTLLMAWRGRVSPVLIPILLADTELTVALCVVFIRRSEWKIRPGNQKCTPGGGRGGLYVPGLLGTGIRVWTIIRSWSTGFLWRVSCLYSLRAIAGSGRTVADVGLTQLHVAAEVVDEHDAQPQLQWGLERK